MSTEDNMNKMADEYMGQFGDYQELVEVITGTRPATGLDKRIQISLGGNRLVITSIVDKNGSLLIGTRRGTTIFDDSPEDSHDAQMKANGLHEPILNRV
jgi:hypothetical protein